MRSMDGEEIMIISELRHGPLVRTKVHGRPQLKADILMVGKEAVSDMNGILAVEQMNIFFQDHAFHVVPPNWHLIFEAKFLDAMGSGELFFRVTPLFSAKLDFSAIRKVNEFRQMVEHDHAAKRGWQCRDEQAVVTPGNASGERSRRVAAQPIGDEPLATEQLQNTFAARLFQIDFANYFSHWPPLLPALEK